MRLLTMIFIIFSSITILAGVSYGHHDDTFITIKRVPPIMPAEAYQSGYCCMGHGIDKDGNVLDVKVRYCTENYLAAPSIVALSQWKYDPKRKDGTSTVTKNEDVYISFLLSTYEGEIIPGKHGFMTLLLNGERNREKVCDDPLVAKANFLPKLIHAP